MNRRRKTLDLLYAEIRQWQRQTFPHATSASCVKHLQREVAELVRSPSDASEIADCLMLVFETADRAGIDLAGAVQAKLEICKSRKWSEPDSDGVVEHVREGGAV